MLRAILELNQDDDAHMAAWEVIDIIEKHMPTYGSCVHWITIAFNGLSDAYGFEAGVLTRCDHEPTSVCLVGNYDAAMEILKKHIDAAGVEISQMDEHPDYAIAAKQPGR